MGEDGSMTRMIKWFVKSNLGTLLGSVGSLALLASCSSGGSQHPEAVADAQQHLSSQGAVSVSVLLKSSLSPTELAAARLDVQQQLKHARSKVVYNFTSSPGMSLVVGSDADLQALAANPAVDRFDVTPEARPMLSQTRQITGANTACTAGFNGSGRRVAVIGSGSDIAHNDLKDDLVDEVCFCNDTFNGPCCPNGTIHQFGPGAAAESDLVDGHGTHVSGIITSAGTIAPRGIAPNAKIIAARAGSFADIAATMDYLAIAHPEIDAVNLSIGTFPTYGDNCDLGTSPPATFTIMANAIHNLRSQGILTVIAAGQDAGGVLGSKNAM